MDNISALDKKIINRLQYGFPISDYPYRETAKQFGISEQALIVRIKNLLKTGLLTRFGPLFNAENLGGALSLCAMKIADNDFERVTAQVNVFPQVAHNYQREHALNMWFVLATESLKEKQTVLDEIKKITGYDVYDMPKEKEYFVGLFLTI